MLLGACGGSSFPSDLPLSPIARNNEAVRSRLDAFATAALSSRNPPVMAMTNIAPFRWDRVYIFTEGKRSIQRIIRRQSGFVWRGAPGEAVPLETVGSLMVFVNKRHVVSAVRQVAPRVRISLACLGQTSRRRERSQMRVYRSRTKNSRTGKPDPGLYGSWVTPPSGVGCLRAELLPFY